jgi:hypothetical protein
VPNAPPDAAELALLWFALLADEAVPPAAEFEAEEELLAANADWLIIEPM